MHVGSLKVATRLISKKLNMEKSTLLGSIRQGRIQGKLLPPRLERWTGDNRESRLPEQRLSSRNHPKNQCGGLADGEEKGTELK